MKDLDNIQIVSVTGCADCPFMYTDDWGYHCTRGGSPDTVNYIADNWFPKDCPLKQGDIQVELKQE